jgi:hypothetical protein
MAQPNHLFNNVVQIMSLLKTKEFINIFINIYLTKLLYCQSYYINTQNLIFC